MSEGNSPVVASLENRSTHPYSSIALSPSRQHAVAAAKDTLTVLSVGPSGLSETRSLRVSQQFQAPVATSDHATRSQHGGRNMMDIRDTFGYPKQSQPPQNMTNTNVTITHVVWSPPQKDEDEDDWLSERDSFLAAAGSNGVFVIWNARRAVLEGTASSMGHAPDAVCSHSARAVNRLAWHPKGKYPGHLLSASQDGTVKLWVRKLATLRTANERKHDTRRSWFGQKHLNPSNQSYSWESSVTFSPRSEAIREVRWSPFHDNIFALVTDSGHLIVYNINHSEAPWEKIAAHGTGASTLDWHPTRPYVIATGGIADYSVKIWDLEKKDEAYRTQHSNTAPSIQRERSAVTDDSNEEAGSRDTSQFDIIQLGLTSGGGSVGASRGLSIGTSLHGGRARTGTAAPIHVLSISAAVTRLAWRPPAFSYPRDDADLAATDPHDGMIAIATQPVKGRAGGNGLLSLWSHHRPFMALSVVEGHQEGAVTDFVWLDTPRKISHPMVPAQSQLFKRHLSDEHGRPSIHPQRSESRGRASAEGLYHSPSIHVGLSLGVRRMNSGAGSDDGLLNYEEEEGPESGRLAGRVWQHVLSVGRDGRCLIQSFARGERPISQVPPSCFAMAELSPFQRGCGSLQIFSVHQKVPAGPAFDFLLTGLRRDAVTASAPGVFAEALVEASEDEKLVNSTENLVAGVRHPSMMPRLVFNVVDQGDLDEDGYPISPQSSTICVAPEVVHLSRFAESYQLYPDERCSTRVGLCLFNADVAERLRCGPLSRMWRMLASLLKGSGLDELPEKNSPPRNAMQFALLPTLRSLLEERANAGDVQTCVAICEVLQVIELGSNARTTTTRVPGLELSLVREWYLSFIDILHQMCLFSHASFLIGHCNDASIGELNQQSTTIDEACPHCGKPILVGDSGTNGFSPRRVCRSCRRRIGFCFLCHEPVKGVYVLCPGCGHGGHLDHALEWFGGLGGTPVRDVCPTGCGHRCNLAQKLTAFPITESQLFCLPVSD